ncbi:MAG: hypothetical protein ACXAEN_26350, partial [Candidatus Thorarchaeota archaeon]
RAQFQRICNLLNDLFARFEVEGLPKGPGGPLPADSLKNMIIVPDFATVHSGQIRSLSIYAPQLSPADTDPIATVTLDGIGVSLVDATVQLVPSKSDSSVLYGYFRVEGKILGQTVTAKASVTGSDAIATIEVTKEERRGRKRKKVAGRSGPFSEIVFDSESNPIQPVSFDPKVGRIRLFVNFPFVRLYMKADGKGLERGQSRAVFADLVGEAFCRHMARVGLDTGRYPVITGSEMDNYDSAFNDLRLNVMKTIHEEVGSILAVLGKT